MQKLWTAQVARGLLVGTFLAGAIHGAAVAQAGRAAPDAPQQGRELSAYRPAVPYVNGVVTSGHPLSSVAGLQMLMKGGAAADAAVATMATLNVVEPWASGIGGNGFLTYYDKGSGEVHSLAFTGAAPKALKPEEMTPELLDSGYKASIVPGAFGGWIEVMKRFGNLSLKDVLGPAIEYARNGHPLDPSIANTIAINKTLPRYKTSSAIFVPDGKPVVGGQLFKNIPLANTYQRLVDAEQQALLRGRSRNEALQAAFDLFYKGEIASEIDRFHKENGGYLSTEDLAAFQPRWDKPLHINYRGYDVYSNPPTSRGGLEVLMQLNLVEGYDLKSLGQNSPQTLHLLAEAIKVAKSDIYRYVGDPNSVKMPIEGMLSDRYAEFRRSLINPDAAVPYPAYGNPAAYQQASLDRGSPDNRLAPPPADERSRGGNTTSLSVIDKAGNVLAATPTLGGGFGTGVVIGELGLLLNNGLRLGSTSPYPTDVNYVGPGRIPLLNNSPVIVLKGGAFYMSVGSPGGETIGQTQFQVLVNVLDFGMPIQQAVEAPRFALDAEPNFYKSGAEITLQYEGRFPQDTVAGLKAKGHKVAIRPSYSIGSNQGTLLNKETGTITAGADPRRTQYAIGW